MTKPVPSPFPQVILVDENDAVLGAMEKLEAHAKGLLHRAFSVFIVRKNEVGEVEVLLQQRAKDKYHSGGLWTNTACSHPQPGLNAMEEAQKCLSFEVGMTVPLQLIGKISYHAVFPGGMIEHEIDHVYVGLYSKNIDDKNVYSKTIDDIPPFNKNEIQTMRWATISAIKEDLEKSPSLYTAWFPKVFNCLNDYLKFL